MSVRVFNLQIHGPIIATVGAPITLPGSGVLTRRIDEPGVITLASGEILKGMIGHDENGDPLDLRTDKIVEWQITADGSATLKHLDGGTDPSEQIETHTGADVVLGPGPQRLLYRFDGAAWGWYLGQ